MAKDKKIRSVNIECNDDGSYSYSLHFKEGGKKSSNGGMQTVYYDSETGSANDVSEIFDVIKKYKGGVGNKSEDTKETEENEDDY